MTNEKLYSVLLAFAVTLTALALLVIASQIAIDIGRLSSESGSSEPAPDHCPTDVEVITIHHERIVYVDVPTEPAPADCALLAMARIASRDGATIGRSRLAIAETIGELAASCDEATALVAIARQESTWTAGAVSEAGACGVTQVRSCDADGTFAQGIACCDGYEHGGHHCRPTCEALLDPAVALSWTRDWLRDRGGWDPAAYVGARDPEVGAGYVARAERWLELASE